MDINNKWLNYVHANSEYANPYLTNISQTRESVISATENIMAVAPPMDADALRARITPLHISTQTKSLYINTDIDIYELYESIQVNDYSAPIAGVIKKQIILEARTFTEATQLHTKLLQQQADSSIYMNIQTPAAFRSAHPPEKFGYKFHVSVGFARKNFKKQSAGAFSHCVALTMRIYYLQAFHDTHVKIFNTGKIEIPGKFTLDFIRIVKEQITLLLMEMLHINVHQYINEPVSFTNSNFGLPIRLNLEKLYQVLVHTYKLNTTLDLCKFHGVKSAFYYNTQRGETEQTGVIDESDAHLSAQKIKQLKHKYMLVYFICYNTGKCLITGKCSEIVLRCLYRFFVNLFVTHYAQFHDGIAEEERIEPITKKKRPIKICMTSAYKDTMATRL